MITRDQRLQLANGSSPVFGVLNQLVNPDPLSDNTAPLYDLLKTPDQLIQLIPALSYELVSLRRIYEIIPAYTIRVLAESGVYENLTTAKQVDEWLKLEVQVRNAEREMIRLETAFENSCDEVDPSGQVLLLSYRQEKLNHISPSDWKQVAKEFAPYKTLSDATTKTDTRIDSILTKCSESNRRRFMPAFTEAKEAFFVAYRSVNELYAALEKSRPAPLTGSVDTRAWPAIFEKYKSIYLRHGASITSDPDEDVSILEEKDNRSVFAPLDLNMQFRVRPGNGQSLFGAMFAPRANPCQEKSNKRQLDQPPESPRDQKYPECTVEVESSAQSLLNPFGVAFKLITTTTTTASVTTTVIPAVSSSNNDAIVEPALLKKSRV